MFHMKWGVEAIDRISVHKRVDSIVDRIIVLIATKVYCLKSSVEFATE